MSCPNCGSQLEDFNRQEGGWCPDCEEWWPTDLIDEYESVESTDCPYVDDDLGFAPFELTIKNQEVRK